MIAVSTLCKMHAAGTDLEDFSDWWCRMDMTKLTPRTCRKSMEIQGTKKTCPTKREKENHRRAKVPEMVGDMLVSRRVDRIMTFK